MDDRLKKFVQLVDTGSFVAASRDLHISQPALSAGIAKLERELQVPLIVHGVRPLSLTPAGKLAYAAGKEIMVRSQNLRTQLADLTQQELAVSIGMIDSVASALLTSLESVDELERQASVSLVVDNSRNLFDAVEKGNLDMAFVVERAEYGGVIEVIRGASEPLVAVCHRDQRDAMNRTLKTGTLPRFISYDQASMTYRLIAAALQKRGVTPEPVFHSTSPEVMLRLVRLQKGVAVLPYLQVRDYLADGSLVRVGGRSPIFINRPIVAIKRRDTMLATPLKRTARQLGSLLDGICAEAA